MAQQNTSGAEFYKRIRRAYEASHGRANRVTDKIIAESLGTTPQAVSLWKTNDSKPDGNKLIRAAEATGIRQEWFITGDERFLTHDESMRPYNGPEHHRLSFVLDSEFKRVAAEENISLEQLVSEAAQLLGIPERNLYNYRAGKWSMPASIIPKLSIRLRSAAILKEILGEHIAASMQPLLDGLDRQIRNDPTRENS